MALLGVQLVITIIMVSIVQKISGHYSLARWLLCSTGLYRYLYPENSQLKALAGVPKDKPKKKGQKNEQNGKSETFHIPRNLEIELETAMVSPLDLIHLRFYPEFQWLVDFSVYSLIVYIMSEVYHSMFPIMDEVNLSMVWCLLVVIFSCKMLLVLTKQYFTSEESIYERSMCIVAGCSFLLIAMMVLIIDERNLETGVDTAYQSFHDSATRFLENQGLTSVGPASKLIIKLSLAVWAAIIGAVFMFPGLRLARMHWDCLKYYKDSKIMTLLLNANFALPFLLVLLWIRPLSRDYLTERVFSGMEKPLMRSEALESARLVAVAVAALLRLCCMPLYLQAYLNMAHQRLETQKKEAGRITNVALQKKIASIFYYLCVTALQYVCPLLMCLFLSLMYKTLGGYTWSGLLYDTPQMCAAPAPAAAAAGETAESIRESVEQFHLALDNLKTIFTQEVYRGLLGFSTWWCCFTWFATSSFGLLYQTYFWIS